MILLIRGHIRQTFESSKFLDLVKHIYSIDPTLKIYIHTWSIYSNTISHRKMNLDDRTVTKEAIYAYFGDLQHLIQHIIIDDDTNIQLIGKLEGNVPTGNMPLIGWKNYWYGKYRIIEYIKNLHVDPNEMIINIRFDVLHNSHHLPEDMFSIWIRKNMGVHFTKNSFLHDHEFLGVDNVYIGNIHTMYTLIQQFHYHLDDILTTFNNVFHQEYIVYKVNNILFAST